MSAALDKFYGEVEAKLKEAGLTGLQEWAEKHPGKHLSATYGAYPSCALCGKVEPYDGFRSLCKGLAKVTLRMLR